MLNIEIFDLNRIIYFLTKELSRTSRILSDTLPTYIWNNITNYHFRSFNNLYTKLFSSYKQKFQSLSHSFKMNKIKKIKPINYNVIVNDENYKVIKSLHRNPLLSNNETCVEIKIELKFSKNSQDSLNNKNES